MHGQDVRRGQDDAALVGHDGGLRQVGRVDEALVDAQEGLVPGRADPGRPAAVARPDEGHLLRGGVPRPVRPGVLLGVLLVRHGCQAAELPLGVVAERDDLAADREHDGVVAAARDVHGVEGQPHHARHAPGDRVAHPELAVQVVAEGEHVPTLREHGRVVQAAGDLHHGALDGQEEARGRQRGGPRRVALVVRRRGRGCGRLLRAGRRQTGRQAGPLRLGLRGQRRRAERRAGRLQRPVHGSVHGTAPAPRGPRPRSRHHGSTAAGSTCPTAVAAATAHGCGARHRLELGHGVLGAARLAQLPLLALLQPLVKVVLKPLAVAP